jgi:hypothetical protein
MGEFLAYFPYLKKKIGVLSDHLTVCVCLSRNRVAMQRFAKIVPAAKNTHATIELLDAVCL